MVYIRARIGPDVDPNEIELHRREDGSFDTFVVQRDDLDLLPVFVNGYASFPRRLLERDGHSPLGRELEGNLHDRKSTIQ